MPAQMPVRPVFGHNRIITAMYHVDLKAYLIFGGYEAESTWRASRAIGGPFVNILRQEIYSICYHFMQIVLPHGTATIGASMTIRN